MILIHGTRQKRRNGLEQLLVQACDEAEMQSTNNQIPWAITQRGSALEKRVFFFFFWMVFCDVFRWEQKERGRTDK